MNVLTMVDWPVLLAFLGGTAVGIVVGWLLGGWRAEARSAAPRSEHPTRSAERPVPVVHRTGNVPASTWREAGPMHAATPADLPGAARGIDGTATDFATSTADDSDGPYILLVDDRLELLAVHAAYLRKHGYRTLLAEDASTGLAFARAYHPALIVLDHSMPDRTGVEVARELKADASTADIPILLMTAHSYGAVGAAAMAAGCAAFLPKPVEPSRLLREIEARTHRH